MQQCNKDSHQNRDSQDSANHPTEIISLLESVRRGSIKNGTSGNPYVAELTVELGKPTLTNSILRLAPYHKPEIPMILVGLGGAVVFGLSVPAMAVLLSYAVEVFYKPRHELRKGSEFWALMFLVLALCSGLALPAMCYFVDATGHKLVNRLRLQCFEKIVHMEVGWFDKQENTSGTLGARLSNDAVSLKKLLGDALSMILQNVTVGLAGLSIAFVANWTLALIIMVLLPLIAVNGYVQARFILGFSTDAKVRFQLFFLLLNCLGMYGYVKIVNENDCMIL